MLAGEATKKRDVPRRLFEALGFTGHALQKFAQGCRDKCWDLFPGHVAQTAATRAFNAIPDGTRVGRDLYSAFLARFVLDNRLDAVQAAKLGGVRKRSCEWRRTDSNLRAGRALPFLTSLLASERVA
jgi:hypothetical protein